MGRLKVACFVSLDGVIEGPQNVVAPYFDAECKGYAFQQLQKSEYFLMGRVTYQMFASTWPNVQGDEYIGHINKMKKLVASRSLDTTTWNTRLLGADIAEDLATVKRQAQGDIIKYGVSNLDRTLLEHGLVDEYQLWIIPKAVGTGKRVFEDVDPSFVKLKLLDARRFANGAMLLTYSAK